MSKYSIVVPVYKVEEYLDRCVKSILNQTYSDIELVLVDDGSPDNCPQMCDDYAKEDARIKVVHKKNSGLSDARNAGLESASGEYVVFIDSDDYIELDTCEKFSRYADKEYDILIGDANVVGAGNCDLSHIAFDEVTDGKSYFKQSLKETKVPIVAVINAYRREFLIENALKFKSGILHEDVEFTPRVFLAAKSVVNTHNCFYNYIIREDSITTKKDKSKNACDLFDTYTQHERDFAKIEDTELKELLLDYLVCSYLSFFQGVRLYKYGKKYIHKAFCRRNAYRKKTKLKTMLFCFSPRLYWHINAFTKKNKA